MLVNEAMGVGGMTTEGLRRKKTITLGRSSEESEYIKVELRQSAWEADRTETPNGNGNKTGGVRCTDLKERLHFSEGKKRSMLTTATNSTKRRKMFFQLVLMT